MDIWVLYLTRSGPYRVARKGWGSRSNILAETLSYLDGSKGRSYCTSLVTSMKMEDEASYLRDRRRRLGEPVG